MFNNIYNFLTKSILNLPRITKKILAVMLDIFLCFFSVFIALSIRLEQFITIDQEYFFSMLITSSIAIPIFIWSGVYKAIFRYDGGLSIKVLSKSFLIYSIIYFFIIFTITLPNFPRSMAVIQPMFLFILILISRWAVKKWIDLFVFNFNTIESKKGVLVYDAGKLGQELALTISNSQEYKLVSFIDENINFWGNTINGYPVTSPDLIDVLIRKKKVSELWLSPEITKIKRREILNKFRQLPIHIKTRQTFSNTKQNIPSLYELRDLDLNDLLNREKINPKISLMKKCIFKKDVMVTGAGGSIGSELSRKIFFYNPKTLLLIENSEIALYRIYNELKLKLKDNSSHQTKLIPLLIDVQNENSLEFIFKKFLPQTVYHAAAYKHVPLVEQNIIAGVANNVLGTINCSKLAIKYNVKFFVLISTDKAVRPTNIMGASKRLAEMSLQYFSFNNKNPKTILSMVRFGNVLGSSGSVVPLFKEQIERGGPITITHNDATRYFMTIPEATQLVIQAGAMAKGGEVFILDMGDPIKIYDLAKNLIELVGLRVKNKNSPLGDIEIETIGLRPGEKLYEELLIGNEPKTTQHKSIFQANEFFIKGKQFEEIIMNLKLAIKENNVMKVKKVLTKAVPEYRSTKSNSSL